MRLGAIHKVIERVSQASLPHYEPLAVLAHHAPVGSIDATPWYDQHPWPWLWTLTTETVSLSLMHPHRSQEALLTLREDGQGILGERWLRRLSGLGEPSSHVCGTSHAPCPRVVGKRHPRPGGLRDVGTQSVAALGPDGQGAAHGRRGADLGCALVPLERALP